MSRIHVSFVKHEHTREHVVYRVMSPDFIEDKLIGELKIDLCLRQYEFTPLGAVIGKAVIPPSVFDLPEEDQDKITDREFPGSEYGGWTSRIAKMTRKLIDTDDYPNEVFGVT